MNCPEGMCHSNTLVFTFKRWGSGERGRDFFAGSGGERKWVVFHWTSPHHHAVVKISVELSLSLHCELKCTQVLLALRTASLEDPNVPLSGDPLEIRNAYFQYIQNTGQDAWAPHGNLCVYVFL